MENAARILIVEDDAILAAHLSVMLGQFGYEVADLVASGEVAVSQALSLKPDAIIMDIRLRGRMSGIEAAAEIHRLLDTPVIYLTAYSDENLLADARITNAYAYMIKPVRERELRASLEMALYKHKVERHIAHLNQVLRAIRDINQLLTHTPDRDRLLSECCRILLGTRGYRFVWIGETGGDFPRTAALAGSGEEIIRRIAAEATPEQREAMAWSTALRTGKTVIVRDLLNNEAYAPWRPELAAAGFASAAAIPLFCMGECYGLMSVAAEMVDVFDAEEAELLAEVGGDIAFGLKSLEEESARKRAEEVLRQSEERFSKAFYSSPAAMVISRISDGQVIDANQNFEKALGYARAEIAQMTVLDLKMFSSEEKRQEFLTCLRARGCLQDQQARLMTREGEMRDFLVSLEQINLDGQACVLASLQDITGLKRVEDALRASQQTLQLFVTYAPAAIAMLDKDMRYLAVSRRYIQDYRLGDKNLAGRSHYEVFPGLPERWKEIHRHCLESGASEIREEDSFIRADGREDWLRWEIHPWREPDGEVGGLLLFSELINERKRAEREIKHHLAELEVLYESSLSLAGLLDPEEVASRLLDVLSARLGWHHAALRLFDEASGRMKLLALKVPGLEHGEIESESQRLDRLIDKPATGLSGWVVIHGQVVRSGDVRQDPRYIETYADIQSGLYVPIRVGDHITGSIAVESEIADAFSLDDERLLETLAHQAAIAIENARLYQTAQQKILERARAEQELRASEEKYRGLVESLDGVVASFDQEGRCLFVNEVAARQLGLGSASQTVGKMLSDLFPEPYASSQLAEIQRVIRENTPAVRESPTVIQGQTHWYRTSIQPLRDESGRAVQVVLNSTDITQIKSAQQVLLEHNRILEQRIQERTAEVEDLYNNAPCGYHSIDARGYFIHINDTELAWLGYTRAEMLGTPIQNLFPPASREAFARAFQRLKAEGHVRDVEAGYMRKDGTSFPIMVNASAVYDASGAFVMSRSTVFDMTERKKIEQALVQNEARLRLNRDELSAANLALEKAARLKDDFLASMSHELRTPLTGILGLSEALQYQIYGDLNAKQLSVVRDIESSGRHLLELINDILDLSKIEAGKLVMQLEPCSLNDICQASLQMVRGLANARHQRLVYSKPAQRIVLRADGRRLKQVLVNLLSNAVKFTPEEGELGIDLDCQIERKAVLICVWDKGIGMKPEDLDKIFKPFVQVDSSLSRQYSGTGLGLSLVQRMVEMHGGSIQVESSPGQGSRFTIQLPWDGDGEQTQAEGVSAPASAPELRPLGGGDASRGHVLLVDDNPLILDMLGAYLTAQNFKVDLARSGTQLLENVGELRPDLVVMDIQMPGLDGLETIRRIRAHPDADVARLPVVALTALVMPNDRERCLDAGANEYLSKPLHLPDLVKLVQSLISHPDR